MTRDTRSFTLVKRTWNDDRSEVLEKKEYLFNNSWTIQGMRDHVYVTNGRGKIVDVDDATRIRNFDLTGAEYLGLGTGTTPIIKADKKLTNQVGNRIRTLQRGNRQRNTAEWIEEDGSVRLEVTIFFSTTPGSVVGTFTEVGVFGSATGDTLTAGALIKDSDGVPTSLTLGPNDDLCAYYTLGMWLGEGEPTTKSAIGGTNAYNQVVRQLGSVKIGPVEHTVTLQRAVSTTQWGESTNWVMYERYNLPTSAAGRRALMGTHLINETGNALGKVTVEVVDTDTTHSEDWEIRLNKTAPTATYDFGFNTLILGGRTGTAAANSYLNRLLFDPPIPFDGSNDIVFRLKVHQDWTEVHR